MFSAKTADTRTIPNRKNSRLVVHGFLQMTAANAFWVLLPLLPVGQTPTAVLAVPMERIPEIPGVLVQAQAPSPQPLSPVAGERGWGEGTEPAQASDTTQSTPERLPRVYGRAEYLGWWLTEARLPPLLTTGPPGSAGVLGADTSILLGGDRAAGNTFFNGTRLTLGYWFALGRFGVEMEAFFLPSMHSTFTATSNGNKLLALPFTDAVSGLPTSTIIAGPSAGGPHSGTFAAFTATQFYGQQVNFVMLLAGDGVASRLDYLGGVRFLQMKDRLDMTSISQTTAGTVLDLEDHVYTRCAFYGANFGLRGTLNRGPFSLQIRGLGALGGTDQNIQTSGSNLGSPPGMFVQASNMGIFRRTRFDMVYETGVNLNWQASSWLSVFGGYTFLWWVNPVRAGDQVDTTLNLTSSGPVRPAIPFKQDSLIAQGLNVGLAFRW
jgi:hypothetical protein